MYLIALAVLAQMIRLILSLLSTIVTVFLLLLYLVLGTAIPFKGFFKVLMMLFVVKLIIVKKKQKVAVKLFDSTRLGKGGSAGGSGRETVSPICSFSQSPTGSTSFEPNTPTLSRITNNFTTTDFISSILF